ncbi:alkylhydroperoxidase [Thiohalorhabdus denitrificans]|uniref:Alkylhydroperoxidase AhpD family core domain-containing protein n=1 Tax=Thiohalorhabdus denitrificans TaxID=381306 RepID=A0A0N8PMU0_9GAMM|nr:carboxymuconolactone decarboxylase family protein [Thiohalorhabdus denitrificans]KPV39661.1 alkylhydroperoxidase [Thiohalorhabdus denitrificans]SCX94961.1 alkylhydroperoxidase AhpD family core domain-containing protein [Thiohalorhabdus denitrificans]
MNDLPRHYEQLREEFPRYLEALEDLGQAARDAGPLEERTTNLVQLAAAAALGSEGAVHSHTRRALEAGATPQEIRHTLVVLTSTIGFPVTSAALSWVEDVIGAG